jgi:hypothetical protein
MNGRKKINPCQARITNDGGGVARHTRIHTAGVELDVLNRVVGPISIRERWIQVFSSAIDQHLIHPWQHEICWIAIVQMLSKDSNIVLKVLVSRKVRSKVVSTVEGMGFIGRYVDVLAST